jgi:class 3 adenylate cyclase
MAADLSRPSTRYARANRAHIAYQVVGEGEPLLFMPGLSTHIEAIWEEPSFARYLERLAGFAQLILFDKRGAGLSDPLGEAATLEAHVDDVRAVLDAVGVSSANVVAANESSLIAIPLAATFPDVVRRLVLINGTARFLVADDYPIGVDTSRARTYVEKLSETYGEDAAGVALSAPSRARDRAFIDWSTRYMRLAASPGSFRRTTQLVGMTDVRSALGTVGCPALVLHATDDRFTPIAHGLYLADHIAGAEFVQLDGGDHLPWTGECTDRMLEAIQRFVTGTEPPAVSTRVLATLLFTDIVDSTHQLSRVGDEAWARLVADHDMAVLAEVERRGGRVVDTAGDGVFAIFDGPSRGVEAAIAIRRRTGNLGLNVRAGVHTGEVELVEPAVRGLGVVTAARVMAEAREGGILVSRVVRDLVAGSRLRFTSVGTRILKGIEEPVELFSVDPD